LKELLISPFARQMARSDSMAYVMMHDVAKASGIGIGAEIDQQGSLGAVFAHLTRERWRFLRPDLVDDGGIAGNTFEAHLEVRDFEIGIHQRSCDVLRQAFEPLVPRSADFSPLVFFLLLLAVAD
jgi:hypothetical protein